MCCQRRSPSPPARSQAVSVTTGVSQAASAVTGSAGAVRRAVLEEVQYPGPEPTEPEQSAVPPQPAAHDRQHPRGAGIGAAVTSRGAGWFVASVLAGAVTALSILVAAGPSTTVAANVGAATPARLPQISVGRARVSRVVQVGPGQKTVRIRAAVPGALGVPAVIGQRVVFGQALPGRSVTVIGPASSSLRVIGKSAPAFVKVAAPARARIIAGRPAGGPFAVVGSRGGPFTVVGLRGGSLSVVGSRGGPFAVVGLRGVRFIGRAAACGPALRNLVVRGPLRAFARVARFVVGKKIIARVVKSPLAAAGSCRAVLRVVAPSNGGR
jgi:hypothetical protein